MSNKTKGRILTAGMAAVAIASAGYLGHEVIQRLDSHDAAARKAAPSASPAATPFSLARQLANDPPAAPVTNAERIARQFRCKEIIDIDPITGGPFDPTTDPPLDPSVRSLPRSEWALPEVVSAGGCLHINSLNQNAAVIVTFVSYPDQMVAALKRPDNLGDALASESFPNVVSGDKWLVWTKTAADAAYVADRTGGMVGPGAIHIATKDSATGVCPKGQYVFVGVEDEGCKPPANPVPTEDSSAPSTPWRGGE